MISLLKRLWWLWANALGVKTGSTNAEADVIALIRTALALATLFNVPVGIMIVAGIIRHWNNVP